jgi:hypothetical protein
MVPCGIEPVEKPDATNPECARSVLKERRDIGAGQAIRVPWIVHEHFEFIAVESIQAVPAPKPDEAAIVLDDLIAAGLRQAIRC